MLLLGAGGSTRRYTLASGYSALVFNSWDADPADFSSSTGTTADGFTRVIPNLSGGSKGLNVDNSIQTTRASGGLRRLTDAELAANTNMASLVFPTTLIRGGYSKIAVMACLRLDEFTQMSTIRPLFAMHTGTDPDAGTELFDIGIKADRGSVGLYLGAGNGFSGGNLIDSITGLSTSTTILVGFTLNNADLTVNTAHAFRLIYSTDGVTLNYLPTAWTLNGAFTANLWMRQFCVANQGAISGRVSPVRGYSVSSATGLPMPTDFAWPTWSAGSYTVDDVNGDDDNLEGPGQTGTWLHNAYRKAVLLSPQGAWWKDELGNDASYATTTNATAATDEANKRAWNTAAYNGNRLPQGDTVTFVNNGTNGGNRSVYRFPLHAIFGSLDLQNIGAISIVPEDPLDAPILTTNVVIPGDENDWTNVTGGIYEYTGAAGYTRGMFWERADIQTDLIAYSPVRKIADDDTTLESWKSSFQNEAGVLRVHFAGDNPPSEVYGSGHQLVRWGGAECIFRVKSGVFGPFTYDSGFQYAVGSSPTIADNGIPIIIQWGDACIIKGGIFERFGKHAIKYTTSTAAGGGSPHGLGGIFGSFFDLGPLLSEATDLGFTTDQDSNYVVVHSDYDGGAGKAVVLFKGLIFSDMLCLRGSFDGQTNVGQPVRGISSHGVADAVRAVVLENIDLEGNMLASYQNVVHTWDTSGI